MLQKRQKVLARAPSTRDPRRTCAHVSIDAERVRWGISKSRGTKIARAWGGLSPANSKHPAFVQEETLVRLGLLQGCA
jgi:hypothetical protein